MEARNGLSKGSSHFLNLSEAPSNLLPQTFLVTSSTEQNGVTNFPSVYVLKLIKHRNI